MGRILAQFWGSQEEEMGFCKKHLEQNCDTKH